MRSITSKRGAMELTMGTMVTMVLLVAVLILGGFLVRQIFSGATEAVGSIDQQVKNEINKLFSEDNSRKIVIFPASRRIDLKKGESDLGFGFSIRNVEADSATFTYSVEAGEVSCPGSLSLAQASSYVSLGKTGSVDIPAGSIMADPKLVTFNIPETAPPCSVSYKVSVSKGGQVYTPSVDVIVTIQSS